MIVKNKPFALTTLIFSIVFFVLGLNFPILATKQQILGITLKYTEVKLFDSVKMFFNSGDYLLSVIIFVFTILFPTIKFIDLANKIFCAFLPSKKLSGFLSMMDKWSMLDVFLIALLLLNFKIDSNIIVMKLKVGTTFIAISVILRMISSRLLHFNIP